MCKYMEKQKSMNANENQNPTAITNTIIDPQFKMLMTIRHFDRDLDKYKKRVEEATGNMISIYEQGELMLENSAEPDYKKQWEEQLNDVRVDANQLNQVITLANNNRNNRENFDFQQHWKNFDARLKDLKTSALKFEALGTKILSEAEKNRWESEIRNFENKSEPEILKNANKAKLIFQFMYRYTPENLERINEIVSRYVPEDTGEVNPKEMESLYVKAFREFQREFEPQNLWDSFLELLAGGVHPSPSERVMLEKWADGEQKTREDM